MRKEIPFFALAVLCVFVYVGEATTCVSNTLTTCEKTLFATGKCSSGVCACTTTDYKAGPFGCQKQVTASVTAPYSYLVTAVTQDLTCDPQGLGTDSYEWYKDGTKDNVKTGQTFSAAGAGSYTCKSSPGGVLTDASAATVVEVSTLADKKPVVTGMPTALIAGMKVSFTCVSSIKIADPTYAWYVNNVKKDSATTGSYEHTVDAVDTGKTVKCEISSENSADVTFPASFVDDITGVEIEGKSTVNLIKGQTLALSCKLSGGFPDKADNDATVTYSWFKDGVTLSVPTTAYLKPSVTTTESGSYTCKGKVSTKTEKESAAVAVKVTEQMESDVIVPSSTKFFKGGHFTLTCNYKTENTLLPVTYAWTLGSDKLEGVEDKVLQFNGVSDDSYDGTYKCMVTGDAGLVESSTKVIAFEELTAITSDTPTMAPDSATGVGNKITFTCLNSMYTSPGISYIWTVGTIVQTETSNTFKYTLPSEEVILKCGYKFGSTKSTEVSQTIAVKYLLGVAIRVADQVVHGQTLKPLVDTTIKMECYTSKSESAGTVTYKWLEDDAAVVGETSKYYSKKAVTGTSVTIKCEATVNGEKLDSTSTYTVSGDIDTPTIAAPTTIVLGNDVVLGCISYSYAEGSKFKWYKAGTEISGATSVSYKINDYKVEDNGDYTCEIVIGSTTSTKSATSTLTGIDNEVACKYASDCDGENMDSSVCENSKCKCMSGYTLKNKECSGAASLMGSLVMLVCAVLAHRLF